MLVLLQGTYKAAYRAKFPKLAPQCPCDGDAKWLCGKGIDTEDKLKAYLGIPGCTPNWTCKTPLDGTMTDGCGNSKTDPSCKPPGCTPNWTCKTPLDGTMTDGCGNSKTDPSCKPPGCTPNWTCKTPLDGTMTDGCGNSKTDASCAPKQQTITGVLAKSPEGCYMVINTVDNKEYDLYGLANPVPPLNSNVSVNGTVTTGQVGCTTGIQFQVTSITVVCQPNWQCTGVDIESDGCGNSRSNAKCTGPQCIANTNWQCIQPLNGMEQDDCGEQRTNAKCTEAGVEAIAGLNNTPTSTGAGTVTTGTGIVSQIGTSLGINSTYIGYGVLIILIIVMLKVTKVIH
jgi:hypothetical protein